jgi:hypothetical protein
MDMKNKQANKNPHPKNPNWGGVRAGAGRPKGSTHKIKIEDLIDSIETLAGMSYAERFSLNYMEAIGREDWTKVENYDRALLNKIVADKQEIVVEDITDNIEIRRKALIEALESITSINSKQEDQPDAAN